MILPGLKLYIAKSFVFLKNPLTCHCNCAIKCCKVYFCSYHSNRRWYDNEYAALNKKSGKTSEKLLTNAVGEACVFM